MKLADPWTALAYLVTGAAALFAAFTSWNEREWVLAFALGLVGVVLCAATVFALSIADRDMAQLFRFPDEREGVVAQPVHDPVDPGRRRCGSIVGLARQHLARRPRTGLFAVGGITLGLFAVEVALIVALSQRPAPVMRAESRPRLGRGPEHRRPDATQPVCRPAGQRPLKS